MCCALPTDQNTVEMTQTMAPPTFFCPELLVEGFDYRPLNRTCALVRPSKMSPRVNQDSVGSLGSQQHNLSQTRQHIVSSEVHSPANEELQLLILSKVMTRIGLRIWSILSCQVVSGWDLMFFLQ